MKTEPSADAPLVIKKFVQADVNDGLKTAQISAAATRRMFFRTANPFCRTDRENSKPRRKSPIGGVKSAVSSRIRDGRGQVQGSVKNVAGPSQGFFRKRKAQQECHHACSPKMNPTKPLKHTQ